MSESSSDSHEKRFRSRSKSHFELKSRTQIYENKKLIENYLNEVQTHCGTLGLEITEVKIMRKNNNTESNKINIIYINQINTIEEIKNKRIEKALESKDKSSLSDQGYDTFRQNFKYDFDMPTLREIKFLRKEKNKLFDIKFNMYGVYINPLKKILYVCESYLNNFGAVYQNKFTIKLSGDAIQVAKTGIKLLNFAFALIEDNEKPMSADGNYILGICFIFKY